MIFAIHVSHSGGRGVYRAQPQCIVARNERTAKLFEGFRMCVRIWKTTKPKLTLFSLILFTFIFCGLTATNSSKASDAEANIGGSSQASLQAELEQELQSLIAMPDEGAAIKISIERIDRLFWLLVTINQEIANFDAELDHGLLLKRQNALSATEEPTRSPTYSKLLKYWQLRDRYQAEVVYLYKRCLEIRLDRTAPLAKRKRVRILQRQTEAHIKNSQDFKRRELRELAQSLTETFSAVVAAHRHPGPQLSDESNSGSTIETPTETLSLDRPDFGEGAALKPNQLAILNATSLHSQDDRADDRASEQESFAKQIAIDLQAMPDPRPPRQANFSLARPDCPQGVKVCPSAGEQGNLTGHEFPKGVWALTFDDGPISQSTGEILQLLRRHHDRVNPVGKATFFWLASEIVKFPKWVAGALKSGFPIGNHSFDHEDLAVLNSADQSFEIRNANEIITRVCRAVEPKYRVDYFRCPYGSCYAPAAPAVRKMIAEQGQIHVYWRVDSLDWKLLDDIKVADLVIKQMQLLDRGIVLMHDVHPTTVGALRIILEWIREQNEAGKQYRLVTIPEAVALINSKD